MQPHPTSLLLVAGEASADAHGAEVCRALMQRMPQLQVFGVGGRDLRACGMQTVVRAEDMALAGLTEVVMALPRMWRNLRTLTRLAQVRRPAAALLIDLPDFNLRLATRLKALGIPVIYYISPQIWAWRQRRVEHIARCVDEMLVILPFEQAFYEAHGVRARFVGHPLVEQLPETQDAAQARADLNLAADASATVALLPGSRKKEIDRHLPAMLAAFKRLRHADPNLQAVLPVASTIPLAYIEKLVRQAHVPVRLVPGESTRALIAADAAMVCSGTATLQAALLQRPMVVVYKVSWVTYQLLRRLIKVPFIALVNLIAGRELVPELVQHDVTPGRLAHVMGRLLSDSRWRQDMGQQLGALRQTLGHGRTAHTVADVVLRYLPQKPAFDSNAEEVLHAS